MVKVKVAVNLRFKVSVTGWVSLRFAAGLGSVGVSVKVTARVEPASVSAKVRVN